MNVAELFRSRRTRKGLTSLSLCLSSACGADCIYCPCDRGTRIKQKFMPLSLVEKLLYEISSSQFSKYHNIVRISVGENGDPFLNKQLIEILCAIRTKRPNANVVLFTNFQNFTAEKAEIILGERLIDTFWCNIDGFSETSYFNVKRMKLNSMESNLKNFLEIRKVNVRSIHLPECGRIS